MRQAKTRWRKCLKCNRSFRSRGIHNRLCAKCDRENIGLRVEPSSSPRRNGRPMRLATQVEPRLPEL